MRIFQMGNEHVSWALANFYNEKKHKRADTTNKRRSMMEIRDSIRNRAKGAEHDSSGKRFNSFNSIDNDFFSSFAKPQRNQGASDVRINTNGQQQQQQQLNNQPSSRRIGIVTNGDDDYDKLNKPNHTFVDVDPSDPDDDNRTNSKSSKINALVPNERRGSFLSNCFCNLFCCCRCFCLRTWTRILITILLYAIVVGALLWYYSERLEYEYEHFDAQKWKQYVQELPERYAANTEHKRPVKPQQQQKKKKKTIASNTSNTPSPTTPPTTPDIDLEHLIDIDLEKPATTRPGSVSNANNVQKRDDRVHLTLQKDEHHAEPPVVARNIQNAEIVQDRPTVAGTPVVPPVTADVPKTPEVVVKPAPVNNQPESPKLQIRTEPQPAPKIPEPAAVQQPAHRQPDAPKLKYNFHDLLNDDDDDIVTKK